MTRLLILLIALFPSFLWASDSVEFQVLSLIRSQNYKEAYRLVETAKLSKSMRLALKARLLIKDQNLDEGAKLLSKSIKIKPVDLHKLLLAQTYLKKQKPSKALKILNSIRKKGMQSCVLMAQAHWDLGEDKEALEVLNKQIKSKPNESYRAYQQKAYFLFKMGKLKSLFDFSLKALKNKKLNEELAVFTDQLLKEKDFYLSEVYMDKALSIRPKSALLLKEKGLSELSLKRPYTAAEYLAKAADLDEKYAFDAAAGFLNLGQHERALFYNAKVLEDKKKLKQLFSIYLDSDQYDKAASLSFEINKAGLIEDDKVSYALLYTFFKIGDYKAFNQVFKKVSSQVFASKVLKLKEVIESCKSSWELQCVFS